METLFEISKKTILIIGITTLGIYIAVIFYTRIFGKRSFSKMSSFDFAMTVAVGSIIATCILSDSVSMIEGIVGLGFVYLYQLSAALMRRMDWFKNLIDNKPLLLMDSPHLLENNLKKARVAKEDVQSKLREANVIELSEVKAVIFETTGDISVLHTNQSSKKIDPWLVDNVIR